MHWVGLAAAVGISLLFIWLGRRNRAAETRHTERGSVPPETQVRAGPPFEPQNRLEELLAAGARDPGQRPAFYRAFFDSEVFVIPDAAPGAPGTRVIDAPLTLRLRSWEQDGHPVLAAYTAEARVLEHFGPGTPFVAMTGKTVLDSLGPRTALALFADPTHAKQFTSEELAGLRDGTLLRPAQDYVVPKGTRVRIGTPASVPTAVVDGLTSLFRTKPEVRAAFLMLIQYGEGDPCLAVGIDLIVGSRSASERSVLQQEAAFVARSALGEGATTMDLKILGDDETDRLIRERMQPFYVG